MSDADGVSAADALTGYLDALSDLPRVEPPLGRVRAHGEIHVAQRRALRELGVVTRVASPRRLQVVLTGRAGHSGEVSMEERRDALAAAAEVVLAVESAARAEPPETVATVGRLSVSPGAISVIPERVAMLLDVRGVNKSSLDRVQGEISAFVEAIAAGRGVEAEGGIPSSGAGSVSLDPELAPEVPSPLRRRWASPLPRPGRAPATTLSTWLRFSHAAGLRSPPRRGEPHPRGGG